MFRLALLSTIFAVAAAQDLGIQFERQMQVPELSEFQFNFGGININAELAQEKCPNQWAPVIACVIGKCPGFMDLCPNLSIPDEFEGTVPPSVLEDRVDEIDTMGNMTDDSMDMTTAPEIPSETDGATVPPDTMIDPSLVPQCDELEETYCEAFGEDADGDCCLVDCTSELHALMTCVVVETTGEDRSMCSVPECEQPASTTTTAPAATGSSATSIAPRALAVVASLVALAAL